MIVASTVSRSSEELTARSTSSSACSSATPGGVSLCVRCGPGGAPARAAAFPAAPAQVSSAQPKPGGHYPLPLSPSELRAPLAHADGARLHRRRPPALGRFALVPLEAIDLLEVLA